MKKAALVTLAIAAVIACGQVKKAVDKPKAKPPSEVFIDKQMKIIEEHAKKLMGEGRMPRDFGSAETVLGQYGWHSGSESYTGSEAPLWLLQSGSRQGSGSFGAYSFYQPAFDQAKRQWWILGLMEKGKDLLYALNLNARLNRDVIGYKVPYMYGQRLNATVVDVMGHTYEWQSWGSDGASAHGPEYWGGPLKLSKPFPDDGKEPRFVYQYGVMIQSPDYVDMCACTTSSATSTSTAVTGTGTMGTATSIIKPCVQGGTLAPGESCSVTIPIP